jgi:glycosyltransferase involved in cell wall biosynthesis
VKRQPKKIIVSQPGRQYTHHLCLALQKKGYLQYFLTSIWYKPHGGIFKALKATPFWKRGLEHIFRKRYQPTLQEDKIRLYPWFELFRQALVILFKVSSEFWVFMVERMHDRHVASKLRKYQPEMVIAYEKAALHTFRVARRQGIIPVLDLAQVHYRHIAQLRQQYPAFAELMSDRLFDRIAMVKEQELTQAKYILTLSTYAKNTLLAEGISEDKLFTVNLGFDPDRFKPKVSYRTSGKFRILFVGTITRRKGIHLLIQAFKELNLRDAELIIIGPILEARDILAEYKGYYTYYPFMHHEELAEKYREADIFVFPSYLDSWAMTVVEAMACGTPVVVSEHTGAKDAVQQGGGFIIPVDDVAAIKEKIHFFYEDRAALESLGKQAHAVAQQYTWENYEKQIHAIVEQIMTAREEQKA